MSNPLSPESIIEHILNTIRADDKLRRRFSPLAYKAIAEKCGFELNERLWMEALSKLVQSGVLVDNYEVVDPVTNTTTNIYHSWRDLPSTCEEDYKNIFITYSFLETQTNVSQS